jgi:thiol:disulfide interchange protein
MTNPCRRRGLSRRRFLAAACLLLAPIRAFPATATHPLPTEFDPARDAEKDLATALAVARAARRRVLVEVGGQWCTWCHIMDRFFASNADLKRLRDANFVWLKVNFSKENQNRALLERWPKAAGYPHLYVLDADGRLLQSQDTGMLEAGTNYDPSLFRAFLLEWSPR